jgi:hypothetical protein
VSSSFFCRRAGWETETDSGTAAFPGSLSATVALAWILIPELRFGITHNTSTPEPGYHHAQGLCAVAREYQC